MTEQQVSESCGTIFPRKDFTDDTGCLKPHGHNGSHICKTPAGDYMEWENDYACTCGCWKDDDGHPCINYSKITLSDYTNYINSQNKKP